MNGFLKQIMETSTELGKEQIEEVLQKITIENYSKGSVLLKQGEVADKCYFVLKGCIRKYFIKEDGKEVTTDFFIEEQAVVIFKSYKQKSPSEYFLVCLEDCTLVVGDAESEAMMYQNFPGLEKMTKSITEDNFGIEQEERSWFIGASPEERYLRLLKNKPELMKRVPQHQLASYLGMTPETLSRIKKRVSIEK